MGKLDSVNEARKNRGAKFLRLSWQTLIDFRFLQSRMARLDRHIVFELNR